MKAWQTTSALSRQNDYITDKVKTTEITENLIDKVEKALKTANSKERKPTSRDGSEENRTTQQFNHTMTSNSESQENWTEWDYSGAPDIRMDFKYPKDIYTDQSAPESTIYTQRSKTDSEVNR